MTRVRPANELPPITLSYADAAVVRSPIDRETRANLRTLKAATSRNTAEQSISTLRPTLVASKDVSPDPAMPPSVPQAAINQNNRRLCLLLNTSTIKPQNTETTNKLNTESHIKKTRSVHMFTAPPV